MTPEDLIKRIEVDVGDKWNESNLHGIDIRQCLVGPKRIRAVYPMVNNGTVEKETVEVWLVLEEKPEQRDGYKIIFDEESEMFGLAIPGPESDLCVVGLYGDFLTTMKSM